MGQRSRRPGEQNQDSQKRERITFVRAQFRLPPIRSNLSENHHLMFNPMVRCDKAEAVPGNAVGFPKSDDVVTWSVLVVFSFGLSCFSS